jgi:hypothetical protein
VVQQQLENLVTEIAQAAAAWFREGRMPVGASIWYSDGSSWQSSLDRDSLSPADREPVLAETLRTAMVCVRCNQRPICVMVWFSDHSCFQYGVPAEERASTESTNGFAEYKRDITRILQENHHRLTTTKILQELEVRNLFWGESTIKRALAEMVRDRELNNRRDVRPRGYGLPAWD